MTWNPDCVGTISSPHPLAVRWSTSNKAPNGRRHPRCWHDDQIRHSRDEQSECRVATQRPRDETIAAAAHTPVSANATAAHRKMLENVAA